MPLYRNPSKKVLSQQLSQKSFVGYKSTALSQQNVEEMVKSSNGFKNACLSTPNTPKVVAKEKLTLEKENTSPLSLSNPKYAKLKNVQVDLTEEPTSPRFGTLEPAEVTKTPKKVAKAALKEIALSETIFGALQNDFKAKRAKTSNVAPNPNNFDLKQQKPAPQNDDDEESDIPDSGFEEMRVKTWEQISEFDEESRIGSPDMFLSPTPKKAPKNLADNVSPDRIEKKAKNKNATPKKSKKAQENAVKKPLLVGVHAEKSKTIKKTPKGMNDPVKKAALKQFMNSQLTQELNESGTSIGSMINEPGIKEAFINFMEQSQGQKNINKAKIFEEPPKNVSHREKMEWLQDQRFVGLYVTCDICNKLRYLENCQDPTELPEKWFCRMNPDINFNKCEIPQVEISAREEEDLVDNLYNAGSLVWARIDGYPWWPAIVDDDPDTESYYWLDDEFNNTPSWYHVTFFDKNEVTRAWVRPSCLKAFIRNEDNPIYLPKKYDMFKNRIDVAIAQAKSALNLTILDRLRRFSFLARYPGKIRAPNYPGKAESKNKKVAKKEKMMPKPQETKNSYDVNIGKKKKKPRSKFDKSNFIEPKNKDNRVKKTKDKFKKTTFKKGSNFNRIMSFQSDCSGTNIKIDIPLSPNMKNNDISIDNLLEFEKSLDEYADKEIFTEV